MSSPFTPVVAAQQRRIPGFNSLWFIDLDALGVVGLPITVLDDFHVGGLPFSPHPHAGFAAVTYVFEDSVGAVRSRASNGVDLTVGPGGIVWTEAGSGLVHEETPAQPGVELHGLQLFINLSAPHKLTAPRVLHLEADQVPTWHSQAGDRVRVVVGSFAGLDSPLTPVEPFTMLDVHLGGEIEFDLPIGHTAALYVRSGLARIQSAAERRDVTAMHAMAVVGSGRPVHLRAIGAAELVVVAGANIQDPVIAQGPFIMNDPQQLQETLQRYRSGAMGHLEPH